MNHLYTASPTVLSLRRQQELSSDIQKKKQKLAHLTLEITRIKTKNASRELEVWKLEDQVSDLRKLYSAVKANLEKLNVYEADSLNALKSHFELSCKETDAEMNRQLLTLKEELLERVESSIVEAKAQSEKTKTHLSEEVAMLSAELTALVTELDLQRRVLDERFQQHCLNLNARATALLTELRSKAVCIDTLIEEKTKELQKTENEISTLKKNASHLLLSRLDHLSSEYSSKEKEVQDLKAKVNLINDRLEASAKSITSRQNLVADFDLKTNELRQLLPSLESERRLLHGRLQELKGNIRVFCRIRPAEAAHCASFSIPPPEVFNSDGKQVLAVSSSSPPSSSHLGKERGTSQHKFEFDKVFGQTSKNSAIFSEIAQLVQSSLDGLNVCVFAYGQTGLGKTWTMSHSQDGMIPSSFKQIFSHISLLEEQDWKYSVEGQFVEIYNEQIVDLLAQPNTNVKYDIKHDDQEKKTEILNCTTITLLSEIHAAQLLEMANAKRSTAFTMANSRSSRSHSIFILKITGSNEKTGQSTRGTLNLVDLAGSERLNLSQARGDRLKETQAINKSLSCLADVICSLNLRQNVKNSQTVHIPYRNSKLTYLLKNSLGGDSKTLMFVNISPKEENLGETINSLRFAAKVNNTKTSS